MEHSPSIGVACSLFGSGYSGFFDRWWGGIKSLKKQPAQIVIAHDEAHRAEVLSAIPPEYKKITKTLELVGTFADFRSAMQTNLTTDWISVCDVDDYYLPEAFDELDQADAEGCDIYIDKIKMKHDGSIMEGRWIPEVIPTRMTCPGNAPIKRELYHRAGGHTQGAIFDDWELYIRCVAAGAKPFHASTVRILYDLGYGRVTMSGVGRPASNDTIGRAHIDKVRQELGL